MLKLQLRHSEVGIEFVVENSGPEVSINFTPEVPLGAADVNAFIESAQPKPSHLHALVHHFAQGEDVATAFTAGKGSTRCRIKFAGGVQVSVPRPELRIGDSGNQLRVVDVSLKGDLSITAYVKPPGATVFSVRTAWMLTSATGAQVESHQGDLYRIALQIPPGTVPSSHGGYVKVNAELHFANR